MMAANKSFLNSTGFWLTVIIAIACISNFIWFTLDTRTQPFWDPYPQHTLVFVDNLDSATSSVEGFKKAISKLTIGPRPPLYQLLAVPFISFYKRSADAMLVVNTVFLVILGFATYKLAELIMNRRAGLVAALLVLTYPPIIGLAKIARPHSVGPAVVALVLWLLFLVIKTRSKKTIWLLGPVLGFSLLIHPVLKLLAVPTALVYGYLLLFQTPPRWPSSFADLKPWIGSRFTDPFVYYGLLPSAIITAVIALPWYLWHLDELREIVGQRGDYMNVRYGFYHIRPSSWWYVQTMPGAISGFFTYVFYVAIGFGLLLRSHVNKSLLLAFVGVVAVMWGLRSQTGAWAWQNFAPVLPGIAVISAVGLMALIERLSGSGGGKTPNSETSEPAQAHRISLIKNILAQFVLSGCIGLAIVNYSIVSWGFPGNERLLSLLGTASRSTCEWRMTVAFCPNPPVGGNWQVSEVLRAVLKEGRCNEEQCKLIILTNRPTDKDVFYKLVKDFPGQWLDVRQIHYGPPANTFLLDWLDGDYLAYILDHKSSTTYERAVARLVHEPPDRFKDYFVQQGAWKRPNGTTIHLVKRNAELQEHDRLELIELLDISKSLKDRLKQQLAKSDEKRE